VSQNERVGLAGVFREGRLVVADGLAREVTKLGAQRTSLLPAARATLGDEIGLV
jgi:hypothetical protein